MKINHDELDNRGRAALLLVFLHKMGLFDMGMPNNRPPLFVYTSIAEQYVARLRKKNLV